MCKRYFHLPFNIRINALNCSEEDTNQWCSFVREYLSENFSTLGFVHSPTQTFKYVVNVKAVITTGIILSLSTDDEDILATGMVLSVNSDEICDIDETTMPFVIGRIENMDIPEINELLEKKANFFTALPTEARFTTTTIPFNQIKVAEDAWKITEGNRYPTVDAELIQCVPKVEVYKEEIHNV